MSVARITIYNVLVYPSERFEFNAEDFNSLCESLNVGEELSLKKTKDYLREDTIGVYKDTKLIGYIKNEYYNLLCNLFFSRGLGVVKKKVFMLKEKLSIEIKVEFSNDFMIVDEEDVIENGKIYAINIPTQFLEVLPNVVYLAVNYNDTVIMYHNVFGEIKIKNMYEFVDSLAHRNSRIIIRASRLADDSDVYLELPANNVSNSINKIIVKTDSALSYINNLYNICIRNKFDGYKNGLERDMLIREFYLKRFMLSHFEDMDLIEKSRTDEYDDYDSSSESLQSGGSYYSYSDDNTVDCDYDDLYDNNMYSYDKS